MYTYVLIMSLFGAQYPNQYQQMLTPESCIYYGKTAMSFSDKKDKYFICAPIEVAGLNSNGEPVYAKGDGTVYGGGAVPKEYKNVKIVTK